MSQQSSRAIRLFVAVVFVLAIAGLAISWAYRQPFPGIFPLGSFLLAALLVQHLYTQLRVEASGSIAFVVHLTAGILFGAFWACVVIILTTIIVQVLRRLSGLKLVFNVSQRIVSLAGGFLVYQALGGNIPPEYLRTAGEVSATAIQMDILLFFVLSIIYFGTNSILVSIAISLSAHRRFRDVWSLNTKGVLIYDLGASAIAILVGWFYVHAEILIPFGLGPASLVALVLPVVVLRHIYGMYYRLQESGRELLEVMVKAIEARDPYTSGHSIRVSTLAKAIGVEIGLSTKEVEDVGAAGLLHDVGKIHEEFAPLLRKEDKLTDAEFELLQTHSAKSAELVSIISSFRGAVESMVLSHHERWDGNGYPHGLKGEEIPMGSRIIMVSDTIDAMITDRPYRKALGFDAVIAELQRCKGTQFDPSLVEVVVNSLAVRRVLVEQTDVAAGIVVEAATTSPGRSKRIATVPRTFWRSG